MYIKLKDNPNLDKIFLIRLELIWLTQSWYMIALPIVLMPLNWLLEAAKWRVLAAPVEELSIGRALAGVLAGLSLGFVTPRALGDYAGRVMYSQSAERYKLVGAVMMGRIAQFFATVFFGLWGLMYFFMFDFDLFTLIAAIASFILLAALSITLLQMLVLSAGIRSKLGKWVQQYFGLLASYHRKDLLRVQFIAMLRYMVFATQFYILFRLLNISLSDAITLAGISWTLLLKSILPTFNFLSDLGVREAAALYFFEGFNTINSQIVMASFLLWIINLLFPTLVGLFFMLRLKLKVQQEA